MSLSYVPAWRWWYIRPVVVGNVGDNSVSSYRLHASETQQLTDAMPICYMYGVARCSRQPMTGWLATHPCNTTVKRLSAACLSSFGAHSNCRVFDLQISVIKYAYLVTFYKLKSSKYIRCNDVMVGRVNIGMRQSPVARFISLIPTRALPTRRHRQNTPSLSQESCHRVKLNQR